MPRHFRQVLADQQGISLLLVLIMVAVVGVSAAVVGTTWQTVMQRVREAELLFRGDQYRKAIESYYQAQHGGQVGMFPSELEHLLKDPRFPDAKRHIRQLYLDPFTGEEFELIRDQRIGNRITGVHSASDKEPFKKDGFVAEYKNFKDAGRYRDWEFVFEPPRQRQRRPVGEPPGAPGAAPRLNPEVNPEINLEITPRSQP